MFLVLYGNIGLNELQAGMAFQIAFLSSEIENSLLPIYITVSLYLSTYLSPPDFIQLILLTIYCN